MASLYTSLIQTKRELNDGVLPPMTPVPENVQHFIDPEFTPGLGALNEDPEKGLQCPVRGCGRWYHHLSNHMLRAHADIGGTVNIKRALSIPWNAPFRSRVSRERQAEVMRRNRAAGVLAAPARKGGRLHPQSGHRKRITVGTRNLTNTCEAQIAHRILVVAEKVGRSPTISEASTLDPALRGATQRLYGTWNAALASVGLKTRTGRNQTGISNKYAVDDIVEMIRAYRDAHGRLPTVEEGRNPARVPLIPSRPTILKHMNARTWDDAMRKVAIRMGIYDPRYRPEVEYSPPAKVDRSEEIVRAFGAFHETHGYLPIQSEARTARAVGSLPTAMGTIRHMGAGCWRDAMQRVAERLGIHDERYRPETEADIRPENGRYSLNDILGLLRAFHVEHGHLPQSREAKSPKRSTILAHMNTASWPDAMRQVAEHLDIYDARYRPEQAV